jgi:hypothetical protein
MLRAIEATRDDPAQLRNLVYDIARISLGKQVLASYSEIGSAGLQRHLLNLEVAIKHVEILSRQDQDDELSADVPPVQLVEGPTSSLNYHADQDQPGDEEIDDRSWDDATAVYRPASAEVLSPARTEVSRTEVYRKDNPILPEFLQPIRMWEPNFAPPPTPNFPNHWRKRALMAVAGMCVAIYAVILVQSNYFRGHRFSSPVQATQQVPATSTPPTAGPSRLGSNLPLAGITSASGTQVPNLPLPIVYGVYAVSEGKLYELEPLPVRVPDPRVAISAMISSPSQVTVPNGELAFVIFRRDLVSNAPDKAFIRVVARVVREMKFTGAGRPAINQVEDQWAVRSKAYELRVAPVNDNPEMIVIRAEDAQSSLSPGRYALVIKGQGYDFTVDGQITDRVHCLERTNAVTETVYSECRNMP